MKAADMKVGGVYIDEIEQLSNNTQKMDLIIVNRFENSHNKIYIDKFSLVMGPNGNAIIKSKIKTLGPNDVGLTNPVKESQKKLLISGILEVKTII